MKRKLMLGIVLLVMSIKFIISLTPGHIGVNARDDEMLIVLNIIFWIGMAMWCLLEGVLDENIEQPIGIVFLLIVFGQFIGFLVWLLYTYRASDEDKNKRSYY